MKITNVNIKKIEGKNNLVGSAAITIDDCFVVHDIKILRNKEDDGFRISMPSKEILDKKTGEKTFVNICHPISAECREVIQEAIISTYNTVHVVGEK